MPGLGKHLNTLIPIVTQYKTLGVSIHKRAISVNGGSKVAPVSTPSHLLHPSMSTPFSLGPRDGLLAQFARTSLFLPRICFTHSSYTVISG